MPEYKKLLMKQNDESVDSTSDDSKREVEMALDMDQEESPLVRADTSVCAPASTNQSINLL